jgi:ArsR family transcriptional regulator, arsenate/arsenite/antimonite-responsive transcriptional repressor
MMVNVATKELRVLRQRGTCCSLAPIDQDWAAERSGLMKALGDPTRLTMLAALWRAEGPVCICDFTAGLELTQPTISHHMSKLKDAGLVEAKKDGIWIYYRVRHDLSPSTRRLLTQLIEG